MSLFNIIQKARNRVFKEGSTVSDMESEFEPIYELCKEYTMTSKERMYALWSTISYVVQKEIPGDIIECGVWKGGSSMVMAYTLLGMGVGKAPKRQ